MAISKIIYKGVEIVLVDYTWCKNKEDTLNQLDEIADYLKKHKDEGAILGLSDFTDVYVSTEFSRKGKAYGDLFKLRTRKSAVIGMTSIKRLLLNGYNRFTGDNITAFKTKEEALDWLVK